MTSAESEVALNRYVDYSKCYCSLTSSSLLLLKPRSFAAGYLERCARTYPMRECTAFLISDIQLTERTPNQPHYCFVFLSKMETALNDMLGTVFAGARMSHLARVLAHGTDNTQEAGDSAFLAALCHLMCLEQAIDRDLPLFTFLSLCFTQRCATFLPTTVYVFAFCSLDRTTGALLPIGRPRVCHRPRCTVHATMVTKRTTSPDRNTLKCTITRRNKSGSVQ